MITVSEFVPPSRATPPLQRRMRKRRLAAVGICGAICFLAASAAVTRSAASERDHDAIVSRIPHRPIESSAITAIGYSKRLRVLEIEFKRGGTYRYLDVPPSVHRALLAAESRARFYNRHVRGKYRSIKVRVVRGR